MWDPNQLKRSFSPDFPAALHSSDNVTHSISRNTDPSKIDKLKILKTKTVMSLKTVKDFKKLKTCVDTLEC